jgi:hypothetical protein
MAHDDDEELAFGFGGVEPHDQVTSSLADRLEGMSDSAKSLADKLLGTEDRIPVTPGEILSRGSGIKGPPSQPLNRATMECLRGPCIHHWSMTVRFHAQADSLKIAHVGQCNCHAEATDLTEQNVYRCTQWWPSSFAFVPRSLRAMLRQKLRAAWEWLLRRRGYDFSWRTWPDDVFEADRRDQRGQGGVGNGPATYFDPITMKPRAKPDGGAFFSH